LLRAVPQAPFAADPLVHLAQGLIKMRHAGLLAAVYADSGQFRIVLPGEQSQRHLSLYNAKLLVEKFSVSPELLCKSKAGRKPARNAR
jgi:hypothetical protein